MLRILPAIAFRLVDCWRGGIDIWLMASKAWIPACAGMTSQIDQGGLHPRVRGNPGAFSFWDHNRSAWRGLGASGGVIVWVFAAFFSTPVLAQSLELNLGDKSAEIGFRAPTGWGASGRSQFDGGMLFRDNNPEDYTLAGFGIEVVGDAGLSAPGLQFGVSIKGFYGSLSQIDVGAIAIGGLLRLASATMPRVYFQITGRYAPNVVTFNDGENMRITDMRIGYEILPEAEIYLGYRNAEVELESGVEETIDESGFLGLRILF